MDTPESIRLPMTQAAFDEMHLKLDRERTSRTQQIWSNCFCTKKRLWKIVSAYIPLLNVIRTYNLKDYLLLDFLAGVTIGIMHIPQALGFGMLASVKIVNGLYTSFWPIVLYLIFGTSPHVSIGTSAVICILTANVVDRESLNFKKTWMNGTILRSDSDFNWESIPQFMDYKEDTAMAVSLLAGMTLLIMGILKLGFITAYLSESFFSAFTSGAAVHIATSQVTTMFGITIPKHSGVFKIIYTYRDLFSNISSTNVTELIIAICSIVVLLLVRNFVNDRFRHKLKVPIPIELIVVVASTVVCYVFELSKRYDVKIVGQITAKIPMPRVPSLASFADIIVDSLIIALMIFANTIAMAKICAKKHNYQVDDSQELIAYGMCNFVSAFMFCFPSSIAPPRTMVASSMGVKTSLNGVFVSIFMFLVLTVISSLFENLPKAALGAVIVVALQGLFIQIRDIKKFYRMNIFDFIIWLSTFIGVVFLDIVYGLFLGVCVSLITVVFQTQFANGYQLGRVANEGILVEHELYLTSQEMRGIKIFRYESNIYFANAEYFRGMLYKKTVNPRKYLKQLQAREKLQRKLRGLKDSTDLVVQRGTNTSEEEKGEGPSNELEPEPFSEICPKGADPQEVLSSPGQSLDSNHDDVNTEEDEVPTDAEFMRMKSVHHIIIDLSRVNYMDSSGANVLNHIFTEYEHVNIQVFLACCSYEVRQTMLHAGVVEHYTDKSIFVTLVDAIATAKIHFVHKRIDLSNFSDQEAAEDSYVTKL